MNKEVRVDGLKHLCGGVVGLTYIFLMCWQIHVFGVKWYLAIPYYAMPVISMMGLVAIIVGIVRLINPSLLTSFGYNTSICNETTECNETTIEEKSSEVVLSDYVKEKPEEKLLINNKHKFIDLQ